jgi:hypothetical protein
MSLHLGANIILARCSHHQYFAGTEHSMCKELMRYYFEARVNSLQGRSCTLVMIVTLITRLGLHFTIHVIMFSNEMYTHRYCPLQLDSWWRW